MTKNSIIHGIILAYRQYKRPAVRLYDACRSRTIWAYRQWGLWDRRYRWSWRTVNGLIALVLYATTVLPVLTLLNQQQLYKLSAAASGLVGKTDSSLASKLKYDNLSRTYEFNQDAIQTDSSTANPIQNLQNQVGAAGSSDKSLYALDVPQDLSKGVTYHDVNSQLSFSLVPKFSSSDGQLTQGHIVYPLSGGNQAIYTLKNNGLKEDIVVPDIGSDTMSFSYKLNLPKTLEARMLPDGSGGIGIYSADPALFGNMSYGSDADRAKVEAAREKGAKTYLVFGLPAPVIKAAGGKSADKASAKFELQGSTLTVVASHLSKLTAPITIDPSVVVTSTSDFQTSGNNEGNIDFSTSGQIARSGLSGGGISNGWTETTAFSDPRIGSYTVYDGYLYVIGGYDGTTDLNDVQYAQLTGTGGIASNSGCGTPWCTTTAFPTTRDSFSVTTYNGYLYVLGGYSRATSSFQNSVQYAKLTSTGAIAANSGCGSAWCNGPTFTTARSELTTTVYNGYMYFTGGWNGSTTLSDIQYASIHADGNLSAWSTSANTYLTTREAPGFTAYNGYIYMAGGWSSSDGYHQDVQFAPINADGTLGTFHFTYNSASTSGFTGGFSGYRENLGFTAYNGYMYLGGGDYNVFYTDLQFAPINANGTLGTWNASISFNEGGEFSGTLAYNNYLYAVGGDDGTNFYNNVEYASIDVAGNTADYFVSANTFTTNREGAESVAYNGYLYVLGGDAGGINAPVATIYGAPINTDGSVGTFASKGSFTTARTFFAAVAYNGYMFVLGGCTTKFSTCSTATNNIATVYSSPISSTGTLGTWTLQTSFTTARYGFSAVAYNGTIYIMGGLNGATFESDIQYHTIGAAGAISGAWSVSNRTLGATGRAYFGATVYSGVLYIAGGCTAGALTCTTVKNDIEYGTFGLSSGIGADLTGTGALPLNTNSFTNARGMLGMSIVNGYMYITGGWNGTTRYNDLQFAPVSSTDGSVGTFTTAADTTLLNSVSAPAVVASNGFLYVMGGFDGTTVYNNAQYLQINNGGSGLVGAFANTMALPANRGKGDMAAYNGRVYVAGGFDGSANYNDVAYATINATDGSLGGWTSSVFGATGYTGNSVVINNGYIYVIAGFNGSGYTAATLYAKLNPTTGAPGTWLTASHNFANARGYGDATVFNNYIYYAGGFDGTICYSDVQYAALDPSTGDIGSWATTSSFTGIRNHLQLLAYNGYMYVLDGNDSSNNYFNDVQYAAINSNGTLGSWAYTTAFHDARTGAIVGVANGYMYIMTGFDGTNSLNDVQYASINENGTVGAWTFSSSGTAPVAESVAQGVIYNGYAYIAGGNNGSYLNSVIEAPVATIARTGTYSKLIDLGSASYSVYGISYSGTLPPDSGTGQPAITYRSAGSNATFGSQSNVSTLNSTTCTTSPLYGIRYLLVTFTLDDSMGATTAGSFPDTSGTAANITDFTITYNTIHPVPLNRLRAGQTLQTGSLSALDTCAP